MDLTKLKLTEKRSICRALNKQGDIAYSGVHIAKLNNEEADSILSLGYIKPAAQAIYEAMKPSPAPFLLSEISAENQIAIASMLNMEGAIHIPRDIITEGLNYSAASLILRNAISQYGNNMAERIQGMNRELIDKETPDTPHEYTLEELMQLGNKDQYKISKKLYEENKIGYSLEEIANMKNTEKTSLYGYHLSRYPDEMQRICRAALENKSTPPQPNKQNILKTENMRDITPAPAAPSTAQAEALAQLLGTLTPPSDDAEINALKKRVEELEQTKHRTVEIKIPNMPKKEMGTVHKEFTTLLTTVSCGLHAYLAGPAGSFKTSAAEDVAKALELKCSSISVCQQTTQTALLGYLNAMGDYVTTEFRKRYERGGVFILDEIDNGNANVLSVLNSALANGSCAFPDGMVNKHADFRLIATANTIGQGADAKYIGRCQLDAATLDRFAFIQWDYDTAMERDIASNKEWCERVQSLRASADRLKSRIVISPRATFSGEKLLAAGMNQRQVESLVVFGGTSTEESDKIKAGARS